MRITHPGVRRIRGEGQTLLKVMLGPRWIILRRRHFSQVAQRTQHGPAGATFHVLRQGFLVVGGGTGQVTSLA